MKTHKIQTIRELLTKPGKQQVTKKDLVFLKRHGIDPTKRVATLINSSAEIADRISDILERLHGHRKGEISVFDVRIKPPLEQTKLLT